MMGENNYGSHRADNFMSEDIWHKVGETMSNIQIPTLKELLEDNDEDMAYQLWYQAVSWKAAGKSDSMVDPMFYQMWLEEGNHSGYFK